MRLWTFKEERDDKPHPTMGKRSWRGVLAIESSPPTVEYFTELKCTEVPSGHDQDWTQTSNRYWTVFLGGWRWGEDHFWYDGPRCARWFGFLHVEWSWGDCDKCASSP